jgi:hypothetical protein
MFMGSQTRQLVDGMSVGKVYIGRMRLRRTFSRYGSLTDVVWLCLRGSKRRKDCGVGQEKWRGELESIKYLGAQPFLESYHV